MTKLFYAMVAMCAFAVVVHFTPQAKAAAFATMPNEGGGKIVLTDETCKLKGKTYPNLFRAYTFNPSGFNLEGCWLPELDGAAVRIVWFDNTQSVYSTDGFTPAGKSKERLIPT